MQYRKPGLIPDIFPDRHWAARYENAQMTLCRALDWIIRGDAPVRLKAVKEGNVLHLSPSQKNLEYRIRDEFNTVLAQGTATGQLKLPVLPNGTYFCDLLLAGQSFSTTEFKQNSPFGQLTLTPSADTFAPGQPIRGTLSLEKPGREKLKLILKREENGPAQYDPSVYYRF